MGYYRFGEPRRDLKKLVHITGQYTVEQVFISPFDAEREYAPDGRWHWKPLPRSTSPTGIEVFDAFLRYISSGHYERRKFYARYGVAEDWREDSYNPFPGFVMVLTGMDIREFHNRYTLRTADLLLQYTDLDMKDIARRSGTYDASTLNRLYRKYHNCTTRQRRLALRKQDDRVGFYRLADNKFEQ